MHLNKKWFQPVFKLPFIYRILIKVLDSLFMIGKEVRILCLYLNLNYYDFFQISVPKFYWIDVAPFLTEPLQMPSFSIMRLSKR